MLYFRFGKLIGVFVKKKKKWYNYFILVAFPIFLIFWVLMLFTKMPIFETLFQISLTLAVPFIIWVQRFDLNYLELDEMEIKIKLETYSKIYSLILPALYFFSLALLRFTNDESISPVLMIAFISIYISEKVVYFFVKRKYE